MSRYVRAVGRRIGLALVWSLSLGLLMAQSAVVSTPRRSVDCPWIDLSQTIVNTAVTTPTDQAPAIRYRKRDGNTEFGIVRGIEAATSGKDREPASVTWSTGPLPPSARGREHRVVEVGSGELLMVFADREADSPTRNCLVAWLGRASDLASGKEARYTVLLLHDRTAVPTAVSIDDTGTVTVDGRRAGEAGGFRLRFTVAEMEARVPTRGYRIPFVDLAGDSTRQVIVDREPGQYLGHPTTCLLEDGKTMLCVYPKGHGRGAIVYKRSTDGGRTWSERLPTPKSWATSKEVPTIHRVIDPKTGKKRLLLWSGLYPARRAISEDDGATWSELEPAGDWGGIVVMGFVERLRDGRYLAMFHDDGRYFTKQPSRTKPPTFTLYQTLSEDGGLTWTRPTAVWSGQDVNLCEPGCIRSPDGKRLAVLLRENRRRRNSFIIFSDDEAKSWTPPRELPASLTGDRHTGKYAPDGRLLISFRDTTLDSPTQGDWVAWVGSFDDLEQGTEGAYRVRIEDNEHRWDTAYTGVEVLGDGTFVATTYGHWRKEKPPYILSSRFKLGELDAKLGHR